MISESVEYDHSFKIILVGDTSVGKTAILQRYKSGMFVENTTPTVALEFCSKLVRLQDETKIKAIIWDTAGQEKYRSLVSQHYRKAFGALLVYDVTRKETFLSCQRFLYDLRQWSEPDCVVYLVGNKVDLLDKEERAIPLDDVKQYAAENRLKYIETSAFKDVNIDDSFYKLLEGKISPLFLDVYQVKKNSIVKENSVVGNPPIKVRQQSKQIKEDNECNC